MENSKEICPCEEKNNQQSTKPIGQVGFIKVPNIYNKVPNNSIFALYSELLEEESSDIIMLPAMLRDVRTIDIMTRKND